MADELVVRNMARTEVDDLIDWAAREGWNPGLHDAELFWSADPQAFIAAEPLNRAGVFSEVRIDRWRFGKGLSP